MKGIKDYLEQTNTVLLTKDAFEWLKERAAALDKVRAEIHATAELHEDGDYYLRDEWIDEIFDKYQAEVEKLQPVTPKQKMGRWIPASEPPKKEGKYLVCIEYKHKGVVVERYQMTADFYRFSHIDMSWCPDNENAAGDIVAWRELPEPYKAEKGEE